MLDEKSWEEFQNSGLLWLVNTFLHVFGWALLVKVDDDGNFCGCAPCRTDYRGFTTEVNDEGYLKITDWLKENIDALEGDVDSLRESSNSSLREQEEDSLQEPLDSSLLEEKDLQAVEEEISLPKTAIEDEEEEEDE